MVNFRGFNLLCFVISYQLFIQRVEGLPTFNDDEDGEHDKIFQRSPNEVQGRNFYDDQKNAPINNESLIEDTSLNDLNCTESAIRASINDTSYLQRCNNTQEGRFFFTMMMLSMMGGGFGMYGGMYGLGGGSVAGSAIAKGIEVAGTVAEKVIDGLTSDKALKVYGKVAEVGGNMLSKAWDLAGSAVSAIGSGISSAASAAGSAISAGASAVSKAVGKKRSAEELRNVLF